MRIFIKGGVWKNSEDEILKAAVMKYGLNNWSRVASLMVRKSTKQCKARWLEWLDPSVKKTEWTRTEEEKLLHLAKLFPCQWRTIAPLVGRTAHQCLEHYEKLLDQAQGNEVDESNDPRRVRPGEIDPHPETKPSRADAVEMDEDEKEMLSEARARLANTRGKKAKRKAREKQLEEARRLAALQKRRELKAAGINVSHWRRNRKHIDYGSEIPFEEQPAIGFYAVGEDERPEADRSFSNVSLQQLEGKRRDEEELRNQRDDKRKLERLQKEDLPEYLKKINEINDAQHFRKRTKMMLPQPQLTDNELTEILRLGVETSASYVTNGDTTHALVASQGNTPAILSMRTPQQDNTVMMEAKNAIARTQQQTPLVGESNNAEISIPQTPSVLRPVLQTPKSVSGKTPFRDDLSLNEPAQNCSEVSMKYLRKIQQDVKSSLKNLPMPQNEIEVALPEVPAFTAEQELAPVDMADIIRKKAEDVQRKEIERRQKQSQVVQQDLPRPYFLNSVSLEPKYDAKKDSERAAAEQLILAELEKLLHHDAFYNPLKGVEAPKTAPQYEEDFTFKQLQDARKAVQEAKETIDAEANLSAQLDTINDFWEEGFKSFMFSPASRSYSLLSRMGKPERVAYFQKHLDTLKAHLTREAKRSKKMEQRIETLTAGYQKRAQMLIRSIKEHGESLCVSSHELESFQVLHSREKFAVKSRIEELKRYVEQQKERNEVQQTEFADIKFEQEKLRNLLASA